MVPCNIRNRELEWHTHSCLEIHFVISGHLTFYVNNEQIEVDSGHAILIPANCFHRLRNYVGQKYFRYVLNVSIEPLKDDPETTFL